MRVKKTTIHDVARSASVSVTTVSRYLNQKYEAMGEGTRLRIEQAIGELNYRPNALAQGLKSRKSRTIAVVVVDIRYSFCMSVIATLSKLYTEEGYSLLVSETNGSPKLERQLFENLLAQQVDGIVIQTNGDNDDFIQEMASVIPVVMVDRASDIPGVTNIVTNNVDASHNLTRLLFQEGYQHILYVSETPRRISTRVERLAGYIQGCSEMNRVPWVVYVDRGQPVAMQQQVIQAIQVRGEKPPFAVYTSNALLMLDIYPALRDSSFKIPLEMGIATFDEADWLRLIVPAMTHIQQPTEEVGVITATTVLSALREEQQLRPHRQHVLNSKLVIGESTNLSGLFNSVLGTP